MSTQSLIRTSLWRDTVIGEALERIESGVSPKAMDRPAGPDEFGVLKVSSVTWDEFRPAENKALFPEFDVSGIPVVNAGDLLLSRANTAELLASPVLVPHDHHNLILSHKTLRLVARREIADARYLLYALRQPRARQYFLSHATGTSGSMRNVSQETIRNCPIPLPPLPEQKRIADILDKADAIRRKRQEELDTLSALRSSVFLRLFGDPRTSRTDWPQVALGDVTVLDAPMVDPREDEHIDRVHLGPDRIEKNTGRLLPALTAREEGLISGKFLFDDRYVLYSKIRPYLRKVALPHFTGLCSADVYPIRPVESMATREYLFALLISEAFLSYTTSLPSRASIPKLNRKELAAYTFHLPPIDLQRQYTEILRSHETTTETFGKAADESEHLFNSLIQRAFKGEL